MFNRIFVFLKRYLNSTQIFMFLIFDTETTGLAKNWDLNYTHTDNWPRLVQLAWQLHDETGKLIKNKNFIIKPNGFEIPFTSTKVHGITTERANRDGVDIKIALEEFQNDLKLSKYNVGHNIDFDINVVACEFFRLGDLEPLVIKLDTIDTKDESTQWCAIPGGRGGQFKWPTLTELHTKLFGESFADAHDAAYDVDATARCFFGLINQNIFVPSEIDNIAKVKYEPPVLKETNFTDVLLNDAEEVLNKDVDIEHLENIHFSHLHVHSQFSILQSTTTIDSMIEKAKNHGSPAIALTDHGNMMAAFHFVRAAIKEGIKPIVGCEFNLCEDHTNKKLKDDGYQIVVLAKNKNGYKNLAKLSSIAFTQGFYYLPRIDRELLKKYKKDLIVTTGGLWGEIPYAILNEGETNAEERFVWWKEEFGSDFYVELNRHGIEEEEHVNAVLLKLAKKHGVKYFAANNTYYSDKQNAEAHDILLCVKDGNYQSQPKKYYGKKGREFRFGFPNDEFYIKSPEEMKQLFADLPEALETTQEIVDKIEEFTLSRDVLLPAFDIPLEFQDAKDKDDGGKRGENNYLKHLTYEGAKKRYEVITPEIQERIDFELSVIEKTGYPGYFLIVQDFIAAARDMGVSVGPGRGSAAGSVAAYCLKITNIDPLKYGLLFERFLNPDRVSMPDIDIDFDDEGRQKVIDYVIEKYGANQVAQIITYGSMAAKSSVRDTGRVMELSLQDTSKISNLIPSAPGTSMKKIFSLSEKDRKSKFRAEELTLINQLIKVSEGKNLEAKVLNQARVLEGSVRNTGIHACGVIITPDDITNYVPVALAKDSEMYCTQFDNSVVESAGLLKMDFLGLKTLTLIKDACKIVKERHNIELDPETFPLNDEKTFELFQKGETVGVFQYESLGMQKHLISLKPTVFEDLIAMNALYRPGPMEYIPSFIRRKHGEEPIEYDVPDNEEYLKETYGITVYQEQVMLLSQKLAGFTKGEADMLRKAMGKKIFSMLEELKPKFINQAKEKGHPEDKLEKIWKDWEKFAQYAFNKSHSTCYAWVAYQTAYLKAHYPAEYMASVLSNNMNDIKLVSFFMEECKRMGLTVLGPDVNESMSGFFVNNEGKIRFGLNAVKGTGSVAVEDIVSERTKNGNYKDFWDFTRRVNLRTVNKKTFESLALAGGFDSFEYNRKQFFDDSNGQTLIETGIKYGGAYKNQQDSSQASLFGGSDSAELATPKVPNCEEWGAIEKLKREKEVVGIYISGHPLDQFKIELNNFCNASLADLRNLEKYEGKELIIGGIVTAAENRTTKNGKPFGTLDFEDYEGNYKFFLFGDDYINNKGFFSVGLHLMMRGRVQQKKRWNDDSPIELEYKIYNIELLSEVKDKLSKGIKLSFYLNSLTPQFVDDIENLVSEFKGNKELKISIIDEENNINVDALSRKYRVNPSQDFFDKLDKMIGLHYKLY